MLNILQNFQFLSYSMPPIKSRVTKVNKGKSNFLCKICRGRHGLRYCEQFLKLSVEKRMKLVISHGYCPNCLAHTHSTGSCFSSLGCKHCGGSHHSSLHIHQKGRPQTTSQISKLSNEKPKPSSTPTSTSKSNSIATAKILSKPPSSSGTSKKVCLEAITSPHVSILFPTAVVEVLIGKRKHYARTVIDQCTTVSQISQRLVKDLNLATTSIGEEKVCSVTIRSRQAPYTTFEAMMSVSDKLSMDTPKKSIPAAIATKFPNMNLADPQFYKSGPFSIVFGADLYSRIIQPGLLPSNAGLPVALNTIFGWVLSGSCASCA